MIRELAESYGLSTLKWLTSLRFVPVWIATPFIVCMILYRCGWNSWCGIPFAVMSIANVALLWRFYKEGRRHLRKGHAPPWRFILPQTTAAIFIGVMQSTMADENWSMAILGHPVVQLMMWAVFIFVGFLFTREILLRDQLTDKEFRRERGRRAWHMIMLGLWQSFALVLFFGVMSGRIMGIRGEFAPDDLVGPSKLVADWLPMEVRLGDWFFNPATPGEDGQFLLYPRALISWTVQVFFFSTIFERIMQRSDR